MVNVTLKNYSARFGLFGMLLYGITVPVAGIAVSHLYYHDRRWEDIPLHSALEALEALTALILAILLLFLRKHVRNQEHYVWIACGLLVMGVMDGVHAATTEMESSFIWLRSIANLGGGLLFALIWLPAKTSRARTGNALPLLTLAAALTVGVMSVLYPAMLPVTISQGGYTPYAKIANIIGGGLFIVAAARFIGNYRNSGQFEDFLFANLSLLLGLAGVLLFLSLPWSADFWFWHFLRSLAYIHVLSYVFFVYQRTMAKLKVLTESLGRDVTEQGAKLSREIAERIRTEDALSLSEARYRRLVESVTDYIYSVTVVDGRAEATSHSPGCIAVTGYTPEEYYADPALWYRMVAPEELPLVTEQTALVLAGQEAQPVEHRIIHKDGRIRWIRNTPVLRYDQNCRIVGYDGLVSDITERKLAEEEIKRLNRELESRIAERTAELERANDQLAQANMELQKIDRTKSMFIASMSHELRTPLNSVIGFSSILLNEWVGPLNEEQKENLATVLHAGEHLLALINDVIDVSKIEAGQMDISRENFDLFSVIEEGVNALSQEIRCKGVRLCVENLHQPMHTDRRRLLQCLLNLMSNAEKYTESGEVRLSARPAQSAEACVEIAVADTGIGIGAEDAQKIFEPFVRLESPLQTRVPGTGLGLYLTRKLVTEVLHGEISFSSESGRGSRFVMLLPTDAGPRSKQ